MPEGKKLWEGGPVVLGWDNLPSTVGIGLTDLPNIGGGELLPLLPPRFRHIWNNYDGATHPPNRRSNSLATARQLRSWLRPATT